jgi:hypothetical protein
MASSVSSGTTTQSATSSSPREAGSRARVRVPMADPVSAVTKKAPIGEKATGKTATEGSGRNCGRRRDASPRTSCMLDEDKESTGSRAGSAHLGALLEVSDRAAVHGIVHVGVEGGVDPMAPCGVREADEQSEASHHVPCDTWPRPKTCQSTHRDTASQVNSSRKPSRLMPQAKSTQAASQVNSSHTPSQLKPHATVHPRAATRPFKRRRTRLRGRAY